MLRAIFPFRVPAIIMLSMPNSDTLISVFRPKHGLPFAYA